MTFFRSLWRNDRWKFVVSIIAVSVFLSYPGRVSGQQVQTQFNFTLQTLPIEQQEDMRDFKRNLEDYVEGWDWLNEDLPEQVQFYMEGPLAYMGSIIKTRYASKITVSNGLDIKYLDRWWFFEFERGDILQHDDRLFHSVTWLIDFYVHLMIGHELDKYSEFGGASHFKRAQAICMEGRFSSEYQKGWDERLERVEGILSEDYKPYRRVRMFFHQGMTHQKNKNIQEAKLLCRRAVDILMALHAGNRRDEKVKAFMNAHYLELADVFKTETTPEIYETLIKIDPDHQAKYNEYIDNLGQG